VTPPLVAGWNTDFDSGWRPQNLFFSWGLGTLRALTLSGRYTWHLGATAWAPPLGRYALWLARYCNHRTLHVVRIKIVSWQNNEVGKSDFRQLYNNNFLLHLVVIAAVIRCHALSFVVVRRYRIVFECRCHASRRRLMSTSRFVVRCCASSSSDKTDRCFLSKCSGEFRVILRNFRTYINGGVMPWRSNVRRLDGSAQMSCSGVWYVTEQESVYARLMPPTVRRTVPYIPRAGSCLNIHRAGGRIAYVRWRHVRRHVPILHYR